MLKCVNTETIQQTVKNTKSTQNKYAHLWTSLHCTTTLYNKHGGRMQILVIFYPLEWDEQVSSVLIFCLPSSFLGKYAPSTLSTSNLTCYYGSNVLRSCMCTLPSQFPFKPLWVIIIVMGTCPKMAFIWNRILKQWAI